MPECPLTQAVLKCIRPHPARHLLFVSVYRRELPDVSLEPGPRVRRMIGRLGSHSPLKGDRS